MYKNSSHEREVKFFETFWEETFQFFESHWKTRKTSTLWVILKKRSIKRGSIQESSHISWKQVQFRESYKKKFNTLSHIREKSWILWVVLENFNALSRIKKKNSMSKKKVIFKKKTSSILWVVLKKISSVSRIRTSKKFHFESHSEKKKDQFFESLFFFLKKYLSLWVVKKSNSLSFFWREKKSLNHVIKKGSILRVILKKIFQSYWKEVQFFVSYFWEKSNSLSRFLTKTQKFNSLSHFFKKKIILWVMLKKFQFFESFFQKKKSQFFELFSEKRRR